MSRFGLGMTGGGLSDDTWNPLDKAPSSVLSNANLTVTSGASAGGARGALKTAGKLYFELKFIIGGGGARMFGISSRDSSWGVYAGRDNAEGAVFSSEDEVIYANATAQALSFTPINNNDIVGVAVDFGMRRVYFSKNGSWLAGANPASNSGGTDYIANKAMAPYYAGSSGTGCTLNAGSTSFGSGPPSGFVAWG